MNLDKFFSDERPFMWKILDMIKSNIKNITLLIAFYYLFWKLKHFLDSTCKI